MDEITFEEYKKDYLEDVRINAQIQQESFHQLYQNNPIIFHRKLPE